MSAPLVDALERGKAYVDLSAWWKISVDGADAHGWMNDLLSVELDGISAGQARTSFLLTPTGRIRASVTVTTNDDGYLLLQDPGQPSRIDTLLDPYVLSSDVRLGDRTGELRLISIPGGAVPGASGRSHSPSVLGPGSDLLIGADEPPTIEGLEEAGPAEVENWRVRRGIARFGVDLTTDSLPHEVELGEVIAYGKGCFLGQEAVARVRNLGRPPFVLLAGETDAAVAAGERVSAEGNEAGVVTSAVSHPSGGTAVIARVRWALKDASLEVMGAELRSRGLASAA